jgi:hypothetical protein
MTKEELQKIHSDYQDRIIVLLNELFLEKERHDSTKKAIRSFVGDSKIAITYQSMVGYRLALIDFIESLDLEDKE